MIARLCLLPTVVLMLSQSVATQQLTIAATELRGLDAVAKRMAKAGLEDDTWTILGVLRDCGYPERTLSTLEQACQKEFLKAKPAKAKYDPLHRMLVDAIDKLTPVLDTLAGDEQQAFAKQLLRLDSRLEAPHRVLGHERAHGRWIEPWMRPLLEREVATAEKLAEARALAPQPGRVTTSDVVYLEKLLGGTPGTLAEDWNITIHTSMTRQQTSQIMTDFARAAAFANYLLKGEVKVPRGRPFQFIFVDSRARYERLLEILQSDARMPASEASYQKKASFFFDPRTEYYVMHARDPREFSAYLLAESLNNMYYRPQQFLRGGLANYVCLAVLDVRMPRYVPDGKAATEAALPTPRWLRAESGLVGTRAHIANLVRRGKDPDWADAFAGGIGDVQGDLLLKNTEMMRFLCAHSPIDATLGKCHESDAKDQKARIVQFEAAFGQKIAELDDRWRRWIGNNAPSVAENLESRVHTAMDHERRDLWKRFSEVRALSTGRKEEENELRFSPALSHAARDVARYVRALEPAPSDWKTAHIQDKSASEFSLSGMRAGPKCLIAFQTENGTAALEKWLASFYDRIDVLRPGVLDLGFARLEDTCVIDCKSLVTRPTGEYLVKWPHPNMKKVPTHYHKELRNPVPEAENRDWGYPVTLQVLRGDETPPGEVTMELFIGNPSKKKVVDCYFTSPDAPANPALVPPGTYALIPKAPLPARTEFTVVATFKSTNKRELWKFKT